MHQLVIDMPLVSKCTVTNCAYNAEQKCHAKAITIGDRQNPGCDTFFTSAMRCHRENEAGVGACKVSMCKYNNDFECTAEDIVVGQKSGKINCLTYRT